MPEPRSEQIGQRLVIQAPSVGLSERERPISDSRGVSGRLLVGLAALFACGLIAAGCGGDDGEGAGEAPPNLMDCPDFQTPFETTVTDVRATVDCSTARRVAVDVLGRDDCVEETPGGVNDCLAQGYTCETTIENAAAGPAFVVRCSAGKDRIRFKSQVG